MKTRIAILASAVSFALLAVAPAAAHEAPAKHGGIVRTVSDLQYELVMKGADAIVYVYDHGKPVATAGMAGKLTVLVGKDTSEADLRPAGENRLEAKGVKSGSGARLVATIRRDAAKTVTVRFVMK